MVAVATAWANSLRRTSSKVTRDGSQADQAAGPERPLEAAGERGGRRGALVQQGTKFSDPGLFAAFGLPSAILAGGAADAPTASRVRRVFR